MRIRVTHPAVVDDLLQELWRVGCIAKKEAADTIEADVPGAPREQASIEIALRLRLWEAAHPGVTVFDDF